MNNIDEKLDELDHEIMQKYPEIENAWLYNAIAEKVQLEIARHDLLEKQRKYAMS